MFIENVFYLSDDEKTKMKVVQKKFAKMVKKKIVGREYEIKSENHYHLVKFRITNVLPCVGYFQLNNYRLCVEVMQYWKKPYSWSTDYKMNKLRKGERIGRYYANMHNNLISQELNGLMSMFSLCLGGKYVEKEATIRLELKYVRI